MYMKGRVNLIFIITLSVSPKILLCPKTERDGIIMTQRSQLVLCYRRYCTVKCLHVKDFAVFIRAIFRMADWATFIRMVDMGYSEVHFSKKKKISLLSLHLDIIARTDFSIFYLFGGSSPLSSGKFLFSGKMMLVTSLLTMPAAGCYSG